MRSASATGVAVADSLDAAMMGWRVRGPTRCRPSMQPRGAGCTHTGRTCTYTRGGLKKVCGREVQQRGVRGRTSVADESCGLS